MALLDHPTRWSIGRSHVGVLTPYTGEVWECDGCHRSRQIHYVFTLECGGCQWAADTHAAELLCDGCAYAVLPPKT